jgi:hypothetical protein
LSWKALVFQWYPPPYSISMNVIKYHTSKYNTTAVYWGSIRKSMNIWLRLLDHFGASARSLTLYEINCINCLVCVTMVTACHMYMMMSTNINLLLCTILSVQFVHPQQVMEPAWGQG